MNNIIQAILTDWPTVIIALAYPAWLLWVVVGNPDFID